MKIFYTLLAQILPTHTAYAHCDIPCGVYDPHDLQKAAHTVLRMTMLLKEQKVPEGENVDPIEYTKHHNTVARIINVKEEHGELVEEELGTLENDYFKDEHFKKFPKSTELFRKAVKLSLKTRQGVDEEAARQLLDITMEVAEIFYKTKGFEPVRIASGYSTEGEIVSHK